ncbi:MAG TPA: 2-phospho-L-lactate guanylyltransferase [Candidatus Limnocylindria bacterium]|nr:2-phospho-L-lactate guanylyltransferase [Candidatus Limnocylindria bacterium]
MARRAIAGGAAAARHRRLVAILARDPRRAKSRLAGALRPADRALLATAMLLDVVAAARALRDSDVVVVTESDRLRRLVRARGIATLHAAARGTRAAARVALAAASLRGYRSALLLPADLPLVRPTDLRRLFAAGRAAEVVIAPDRRRRGTNALLLRPPDALAPRFGKRSFARHAAAADRDGRTWRVISARGLAVDVDRPADLRRIRAARRAGSHTAAVLETLRSSKRDRRAAAPQLHP